MEMETRPLLKFLLYPGLLTGAVVFVFVHVQSDFQHYKDRSTGHSETLVPLSMGDLPTLVICFNFGQRLVYGEHFHINSTAYIEVFDCFKTITLQVNQRVKSVFGLDIHISELHIANPSFQGREPLGQCYKITHNLDENYEEENPCEKKYRQNPKLSVENNISSLVENHIFQLFKMQYFLYIEDGFDLKQTTITITRFGP